MLRVPGPLVDAVGAAQPRVRVDGWSDRRPRRERSPGSFVAEKAR